MFTEIIVIFALTAAHAAHTADLPSYINVCGRRNPNLNQCILDNIVNLEDKICGGLPDLNVAKLEPLGISKLVLSEANNNKIILNDVQITGLCNYDVDFVTADLDKLMFSIGFLFKRLYLNGTCDFDVRILVPIAYETPIFITTDNVKITGHLQANMTTIKGKKRLYVSEMKANIFIGGYEAQYGLKREELSQLGQIIGDFVDSNKRDLIGRLTPPLEEEVAKWLATIFDSLFKKFSYDEIYPDRT